MTPQEMWDSAEQTWSIGAHEVNCLKTGADKSIFVQVVQMIGSCRGRIVTSGLGTSAAAAKKISHSLCCIERPSFFLNPGDAVHGGLGVIQSGDLAILISKGGQTSEVLSLLPAFKQKKIPIIAVTEDPTSILGLECDLTIKIKIEKEADRFNMLATTSTLTVIAYFDAICIILMEITGFTKEMFALIHPGGAVGRRLLEHHRKGSKFESGTI